MAQIDASIPLQVQQPQQQDFTSQLAKAYQLKDLVYQDQQRQADMQKQSQLKQVFAENDFSTEEGKQKGISALMKVDPTTALTIQQDYNKDALTKAQTKEAFTKIDSEKLDMAAKKTEAANQIYAQLDGYAKSVGNSSPTFMQQKYSEARQVMIQQGADPKTIPEKYDPAFVHTHAMQNKQYSEMINQEQQRRQEQQRIGIEASRAATEKQQGAERIGIERERLAGEGKQVVSDKDSFGNTTYGVIDKKTGAFKQVTDEQGKNVEVGAKGGAAGAAGGGGREGAQNQRMVNAATEAGQAIENLSKLAATTDAGYFAGYEPGHGLTGITKSIMGRKLTSQDSQSYNAIFTGVAQNLGMLETSGLAAPGSLTKGIDDRLRANEGDTVQTKLLKQAEMGQIVHKNIEAQLSNPRISDTQKDQLKRVDKQITDAIPFSVQDVIAKGQSNESDKRPSLDSFGPGGSTTGGSGQRPPLESFGG